MYGRTEAVPTRCFSWTDSRWWSRTERSELRLYSCGRTVGRWRSDFLYILRNETKTFKVIQNLLLVHRYLSRKTWRGWNSITQRNNDTTCSLFVWTETVWRWKFLTLVERKWKSFESARRATREASEQTQTNVNKRGLAAQLIEQINFQ